jgi:hypothetical protein
MSEFTGEGLFQLDSRTLLSIEDLRIKLRARNSTDVIRNALALLKIAVDNADPDSLVIRMPAKDGGWLRVDLKANS